MVWGSMGLSGDFKIKLVGVFVDFEYLLLCVNKEGRFLLWN